MEEMNFWRKLIAPIVVVKREKTYLFWVVFVAMFGLINIWAGFLMGETGMIKGAMDEGMIYTFSVSLCAPFCTDIFIDMLVDKRRNEKSMFVTYKVIAGLLNVVWIIGLCFLWLGKHKGSYILQIIIGVISILFSSYMYCIGKMERHKDITSQFDDSEYLLEENGRINNLEIEATKTNKVETSKGDIKL